MSFERIDIKWAKKTFPSVFNVFGETDLQKQIEVFNEVNSKDKYSFREYYKYVAAMEKRNISNPHCTILNILSALHSAKYYNTSVCAAIFHLEEMLSELKMNALKDCRNLLRKPDSFFNLIAELDIATKLKRFSGNISLHNKTAENSNKNYDIHCQIDKVIELDADVKWFQNFLVKERGLDPLSVFESLLKDDIQHFTVIKIQRYLFRQEDAIAAALEALEMYKHKDNLSTHEFSVNTTDIGKYIAHINSQDKFIESIIIREDVKVGFIAFLYGFSLNIAETDSIRSNLIGASTQIPSIKNRDHLPCVFLGTQTYTSDYEVEHALFYKQLDNDSNTFRGLFIPDDPEYLKNIKAVIFFSINYENVSQSADEIVVVRTCKYFENNNMLTEAQKTKLDEFIKFYLRNEKARIIKNIDV